MTFICEVVLHICIMCLRHIAHRLWGTWLPITYNCPLRRAGFWICSLAHSCTWAWRWWWQNLEDFIRWIYWICQYRAVINVVEYNLALHCKRNLSQSRPWLPIENMPLGVIACICSYPLYKTFKETKYWFLMQYILHKKSASYPTHHLVPTNLLEHWMLHEQVSLLNGLISRYRYWVYTCNILRCKLCVLHDLK